MIISTLDARGLYTMIPGVDVSKPGQTNLRTAPLEYQYQMDRKTGEKKVDVAARPATQAGSAVVPLGIKVPVATLSPGSYRVELRALDSAGKSVKPRTADFELE